MMEPLNAAGPKIENSREKFRGDVRCLACLAPGAVLGH